MTDERCEVCQMRMHRYGFPADRDGHNPTAIACINGIIGQLEAYLDEPCPRAVVRSLTFLAQAYDTKGCGHD